MLHLDVLSAYTICGAGALVGAALLRPSLGHDAQTVQALRLCRFGLALLGGGLMHLLVVDRPPPAWSQALMSAGSTCALSVLAWAVAALAGRRHPLALLWLALAVVLTATLLAVPLGTRAITWVCAWGLAVAASLMVWMARHLVMRPRDLHERLLGLLIAGTLPTYWLRAGYTLTWEAPYEAHLLHLPSPLVTPYALMYGVLPILFVLLLFNVLNARLQRRLHERAMTDHLTGALSRHALAEGAGPVIAARRAQGGALAVIMIDLDHFKRVNDDHGHAGGDAVLQHAVKVLRRQLRDDTLLVRYGGEEFVALVPVDDLVVARRVAERLRQALQAEDWSEQVPGLGQLTASLGVTLLASHESFERALARADEALYRAKDGGRNQVQVALAAA